MEAVIAGTQRHLLELAFGLDPDQFEQFLVVSLERNPGFAEQIPTLEARGVRVLELPMSRNISPGRDWRALRELSGIIARLQPDIVHGHSAKGGFLARMAARRARVPAVYTPHVLPFRKYDSRLKRWVYVALERYAGCRTDFLIAVSESERQAALTARLLPPERIVLIPNGIVAEDYYCPQRRDAVRRRLGIDDSTPLIGVVGNLRPQKDYETFVKAAALVAAHVPTRFVIAGAGPLRGQLTSLIKRRGLSERFIMPGWFDDISGLLAALDLFVISSRYEGCPYALLEAMAAETPVVGTAVPGIEEIVGDGQYGRLAPARDAEALAVTIRQAIIEPEVSQQRAVAAREMVQATYSLQDMLARTAELYERCVVAR